MAAPTSTAISFKKTLANTEPSTHGTNRKWHWRLVTSAFGRLTDITNVVAEVR